MNPVASFIRIERSALIRAPRARVWRAIADVAEFSTWFLVNADGPFTPGARVHMVTTHPDYAGLGFDIVVGDVVPEERLSWKWQPGVTDEDTDLANEPWTQVEFHLADEDGGTRVTLTESGFEQLPAARRTRVFHEQEQGWEEQLRNVSRYAERKAATQS
jgi:uncharacterized protein YndB with AHSA1/START domain